MIFQISCEKEKLKFPVNPPEILISGGGLTYTDVMVVSGGERTIIGNENLDLISFSSFFPKDYDASFCSYKNIPSPWEAVKKINQWRSSGSIIKLLITTTNINLYTTIRKFDYREKGGELGDVYFDIEFKQYKFVKIREVMRKQKKITNSSSTKVEKNNNLKNNKTQGVNRTDLALFKAQSQSSRPNLSTKSKTYKVIKGDTLWIIAKKFYGTGAEYEKIVNANSKEIKNPNNIRPGQVLTIP